MCYVRVTYVWRMKCTRDVSTAYVLRSILICGVSVLYQLLFNTYENKRLCSLFMQFAHYSYQIIEPPHGKKPTICIGKNKGADQLRINCGADQCLCFLYMDSTIPLLSKPKISSLLPSSETVQAGLCQTWSEPKLLVFSRTAHKRGRRCHRRNLNNLD